MEKNAFAQKMFWGVRGLTLALLVILIVLSCAGTGWTQHSPQRLTQVSGEIRSDRVVLPNDLTAELSDMERHFVVHRAPITRQGQFEFHYLETGFYKLRIADGRGDALYEEFIHIHPYSPPIQIRLSERARARPSGGVVSVNQLRQSQPSAYGAEGSPRKRWPAWFWSGIRGLFRGK